MNDIKGKSESLKPPWVRLWGKFYSKVYLVIWGLAFLGFVFTIGILTISGQFVFNPDAEITEFAVCLDKSYQPVNTVPMDVDYFYVCGFIEGTTRMSASLAILKEGRGIYGENFEQYPGYFYMPIELSTRFTPGDYVVKLGQSRKEIASVDFSVIDN